MHPEHMRTAVADYCMPAGLQTVIAVAVADMYLNTAQPALPPFELVAARHVERT